MPAEIGQPAPEFTLTSQHGEKVSLSDYRGQKNVVLMFYPFAFTGTCTGELCAIRDRYTDFVNDDSVVLSVSCDSPHTLRVFAEQEGLTHPMLSDFWPHGTVSREYGAFLEEKGFATRATFVIDKAGVVRWSVINGPGEARSADDYAAALADLA
ncbi:MAG: mycoredoxin-dependent peroxiredoxin [Actinomycetota bacterium]|jgi:peroxiredoxin|nr:mycoredoxin-dependent peroxiredoxin [Actinomycetota bacterium]